MLGQNITSKYSGIQICLKTVRLQGFGCALLPDALHLRVLFPYSTRYSPSPPVSGAWGAPHSTRSIYQHNIKRHCNLVTKCRQSDSVDITINNQQDIRFL